MKILLLLLFLASCAATPRQNYSLQTPAVHLEGKIRQQAVYVARMQARAGYETEKMAYSLRAYQIDYFAKNRWAAQPAAMIFPLLQEAVGSRFAVVAKTPAEADTVLETEILLFQQEFAGKGSRAHIVIRAHLAQKGHPAVVRDFDESEDASPDPYGGVVALNKALARMLVEMARFSAGEI